MSNNATRDGWTGPDGRQHAAKVYRRRQQYPVFSRSPPKVKDLVKEKAAGASSLAGLVKRLQKPRAALIKGKLKTADISRRDGGRAEDNTVVFRVHLWF